MDWDKPNYLLPTAHTPTLEVGRGRCIVFRKVKTKTTRILLVLPVIGAIYASEEFPRFQASVTPAGTTM